MRFRSTIQRGAALGLLLLAGGPVPGGAQSWNQAYGNGNNTSFMNVTTNVPIVPAWSFSLAGKVSWGGPAINDKGSVWVGTVNGVLHEVLPNGTQRCLASFGGATITSTPAILPNRNVALLLHRPDGTENQTSLVLVSASCAVLWEKPLPRLDKDYPSWATGSVKLWTSARTGATFLFVHGIRTNERFAVEDPDRNQVNEILVFATDGSLFARQPLSRNCIDVGGGGGFDGLSDFWDWATSWWPEPGQVDPLYKTYGWPNSTPAVVSAILPGLSSPAQPLVAVTDDTCEPRLDLFQFRPDAVSFDDRLFKTWSKRIASDGTRLSSPAVTDEGRALIGGSDNRLRTYNLLAQALLWEEDTKEPVMHPPAISPSVLYTFTDYLSWLFKPDGGLFETARVQPMPTGSKLGAGAASANQAFTSHYKGVEIMSPDLLALGHALREEHFLSNNPALTPGGRLYVISETGDKQSLLIALGPP